MKHVPLAPDLWSSVQAMLARLMHLIGAATATVLTRLNRCERAQVFGWLIPLEAMVRKLLLIEAAALPAQTAAAARMPADTRRDRQHTPSRPAFNLLPETARERAHPARIRSLGPPLLVRDIWRDQARAARIAALRNAPRPAPNARLANRIAALARAIAKPLLHARRLARLLKRKLRAGDIARRIAFAFLRTAEPLFREADFDEAGRRACATPFCDTS